MSAAYVDQELKAEFGRIPPSFLPLGNKRLFQQQFKTVPASEEVFITLPSSFVMPKKDEKWLNENIINVIRIDEGLSLGESLNSALLQIKPKAVASISILFGDTLILDLPKQANSVSISKSNNGYDWAYVNNNSNRLLDDSINNHQSKQDNVVCGFFKFSDFTLFVTVRKVGLDKN